MQDRSGPSSSDSRSTRASRYRRRGSNDPFDKCLIFLGQRAGEGSIALCWVSMVMRTGSETRRPSGPSSEAHSGLGQESHQSGWGGSSDTDIGPLFRDLRRCLKLSMPELARRLETKLFVIEALESGDLGRLPPWPETVRVVSAFTMIAKIDPRPVLQLMRQRLESGATAPPTVRTRPGPSGLTGRDGANGSGSGAQSDSSPGAVPEAGRTSSDGDGLSRWRIVGSRPAIMLGLAAVGAVVLLTSALPLGQQQASAASGSGFLGRLVAGIQGYLGSPKVSQQDGMTLIDVGDPRSRKADKLRPSRQ